jgi:hypothetical protein
VLCITNILVCKIELSWQHLLCRQLSSSYASNFFT